MYILINNTPNSVSELLRDVGYPTSRFECIFAEKHDDVHKMVCQYIKEKDYNDKPTICENEIMNACIKMTDSASEPFDGLIYVSLIGLYEPNKKLAELFDFFNKNDKMVVTISSCGSITYSRTPLLIASTSKDKVNQIIFAIENTYPNKYKCYKLNDLDINYEVEEPFLKYNQNAMKKSSEYAIMTNMITISDDTGVEIQALNGEPGIKSARWGDISKQPAYLNVADYMKENELSSVCKMITCISISIPNDDEILTKSFTTSVDGFWCWNPQGEFGFAYDPYFLLPTGKTIAQYNINEQFTNGVTPRMKSTVQAIKYLNVF